ncbi:serine/threonine-protein kinase MARK2-like [Gigantopelta aegis]|uniref:serine/threonine-protein kinase MARK2-like n=1 Tax=Gigantopelta aegis TaxID=1735272 RepID=UPI001B88C58A|nr:serine/threonine-protein kinase MARK2-like [Gigantopelta aegis]
METENSYYLVTELCQSGDLMDYICKRKKLDEKEVRRYIGQIVSAVDYLHRSGILHRDLKIENLLLDENKDIKIIDFGLSNSIRVINTVDGPRAQEYCVTQCGSPAYAAPELLSHKKYGPQVDIWSIGVNMYAMLTGNLPFTVEPFNIKTLHNKMMKGDMNPIPVSLTKECKDLMKRFLTPDPGRRIALNEVMRHPWLTDGHNRSIHRHPYPNKLKADEMDNSILKHMSENMGFRMGEIIRFVTGNVPSSANATYQMLHRKHIRYKADLRVKGKVPATDARLIEPTRISLVFQDIPSKKTTIVPFNPKLLSKRQKDENGCQLSPRCHLAHAPHFEHDVTLVEVDEVETKVDTSRQNPPDKPSVPNEVHVSQSAPSSPSTRHPPPHPITGETKRQQNQTPRAPPIKHAKDTQKYSQATPRPIPVTRHHGHAQTARTESDRKTFQTPRLGVPVKTGPSYGKNKVVLSPRPPQGVVNQNAAGHANGRMFVHFGKRSVPFKNVPPSTSVDIPTEEPKTVPLISTPQTRVHANISADFRPAMNRTIQHDLKQADTVNSYTNDQKTEYISENRPASPLKKAKIHRRLLKRVRKDMTEKYSTDKLDVVAEKLLLDVNHAESTSTKPQTTDSASRKDSCPVLHTVSPHSVRTQ